MRPAVTRYIIRFGFLAAFIFIRNMIVSNQAFFGRFYTFIHSIIEFFIFFTILNIVTAILVMIYRLRKNIPYKFTDNVINGINNLYYLVFAFGIIVMILGFWGIDIKNLLTSLSIVAAAIAIMSKEYVMMIISGIIISFSNEINIDDYVKIGDNKGKILDINLTKITILNEDDDIIYIPNDKVYMSEIINYTKKEIKKVSLDFELDLKYLTSIEDLENKLSKSLLSFNQYIEPDSLNLKIVDVHFEYVKLKLQYQLKEVNRDVERLIRKKTSRLIVNAVKEADRV